MDADKLRTGSGSWRINSVRHTVWRPGAMRYGCTIGMRYVLTMLCGAQSRKWGGRPALTIAPFARLASFRRAQRWRRGVLRVFDRLDHTGSLGMPLPANVVPWLTELRMIGSRYHARKLLPTAGGGIDLEAEQLDRGCVPGRDTSRSRRRTDRAQLHDDSIARHQAHTSMSWRPNRPSGHPRRHAD